MYLSFSLHSLQDTGEMIATGFVNPEQKTTPPHALLRRILCRGLFGFQAGKIEIKAVRNLKSVLTRITETEQKVVF